jgi:hypothetical protein
MRRILVLLIVAASSLIVGCAGGAVVHPSPGPTNPFVSPTPVLSQSWQLVIYLHQLSKYVKRDRAIAEQSNGVASSRAYKQNDRPALQARYYKIANELVLLDASGRGLGRCR